MAKLKTNENYMHECDSAKYNLKRCIQSISAIYSEQDFKTIAEFYLLNAPVLKSGKSDAFGLKSLHEYNWRGNSDMNKLERELLKSSGLSFFCFIKASSIDDTLIQMNLEGDICGSHPRAVMLQNCSATIHENGQVEVKASETRMECLFRHIRNSIAHNHTYILGEDAIVLEDIDTNSKITARIMLFKKTLIEWIPIISRQTKNVSQIKSELSNKSIDTKSEKSA